MHREKQELSYILSVVPFGVVCHETLMSKGEEN